MDLKEYIKSLVREMLDEESSTGAIGVGAGPIMTPRAFAPKGQKENAATKAAKKQGMEKAPGMPKHSKVYDYKEMWPGKKSAMNESSKDKIISQIMGPDHALAKKPESEWTKGEHELFNNLMKQAEKGKTPKINESLNEIIEQELLNEVTYHSFKNEVKFRTKNEQLHKAIREVKRKLQEIDRIVEYTSRMKQELSEGEEGLKYWKKTESNIATISEMVNQLNNKIKNLHQ